MATMQGALPVEMLGSPDGLPFGKGGLDYHPYSPVILQTRRLDRDLDRLRRMVSHYAGAPGKEVLAQVRRSPTFCR